MSRAAIAAEHLAVDREIADLALGFRFLLDVTPLDDPAARARFLGGDRREPEMRYRPLEDDPSVLAARLAAIDVGAVEDATIAHLLLAKRRELELQLEMLRCRASAEFLGLSIELYGTVSPALLRYAERILDEIDLPAPADGPALDAGAFARRANEELDRYRAVAPDIPATVTIREDATGILVSNGDLLISPSARVPESRVDAILQHEIGTHVVTHVNGSHQPLRTLAAGLAGYDETQEGLAVLAEHLVGGFTAGRARQLSARVVAVHLMVEGHSFVLR